VTVVKKETISILSFLSPLVRVIIQTRNRKKRIMTNIVTFSPVQVAKKLEIAFHEFDPTASVPPQMIYNYLQNNVRKLADRAELVSSPTDRNPQREVYVFDEYLVKEFIAEMVSARKERIAKREAKKNANKAKNAGSLQSKVRG
jgi:hypothetical protein